MWRKVLRKKRKGTTLLELVVAVGLFAVLTTMVVILLSMTTTATKTNYSAYSYYRGVDSFVFNLLTEVKSAESLVVDDDTLTLYFPDNKSVLYRIDNFRGKTYRNNLVVSTDFYAYYFIPVDETEVQIRMMLTEDDEVTYTLRCGSVDKDLTMIEEASKSE